MKQAQASVGKVRIIAGKWRGRNIRLPDNPELRPTPSRVRETLFNWLAPVIENANCLDLYAGSGALGFEALSRGASRVTMVERSRYSVNMLDEQAKALQATDLNIICDDADNYLASSKESFDIVFLDPPFSKNLLQKACESLLNKGHLHSDALVYLESDSEISIALPFKLLKKAKAGKVHYVLLENTSERKIEE